jgi:hypothetical protein
MSKNASGLRRGDHVRIIKTDATGTVVDVDVHTIVVRTGKPDGEPQQHHYRLDEVERLPDTKERALLDDVREKHEGS